MRFIKFFLLSIICTGLLSGCFEDQDDIPQIANTIDINDFIWRGMNDFYLYKDDVPDLADNRFSTNKEYTDFLNQFSSPEEIYEGVQVDFDNFSFLRANFVTLERFFDGVTRNNGMDFWIVQYPNDPSNRFGFVRCVLPGTDAETKGLKRGDIFNTVNGTQLTNENFRQLLRQDMYTIGMATFDGTNITSINTEITLTKEEYTENPVFINKTLTVGGNPIGYLMYNGFTADFDNELNNAFAQLKSQNITDLIIDLRYNGGGSVESAVDLASMITGQFDGDVFTTQEWNSVQQSRILEEEEPNWQDIPMHYNH